MPKPSFFCPLIAAVRAKHQRRKEARPTKLLAAALDLFVEEGADELLRLHLVGGCRLHQGLGHLQPDVWAFCDAATRRDPKEYLSVKIDNILFDLNTRAPSPSP